MLRAFEVEQYKSLRRVKLELGPVHILIGPNASGKSNLIDALRFLQEAVVSDVETAAARRGGIENLLFRGRRQSRLLIKLQYQSPRKPVHHLTYYVQIAEVTKGHPMLRTGMAGVREEYLTLERTSGSFPLLRASWGDGQINGYEPFQTGDTGILGLKAMGFLEEHSSIRRMRVFIEGWQFLQIDLAKIREPQRDRRAARLAPDGSNLANVLRTLSSGNPAKFAEIVSDVRSLLAQVEDLRLEVERGQVLLLVQEKGFARAFDPLALSDGTLRILALVTALHTIPEHGLLCVEEPEHGLHPLLLGPLLALIRERCPKRGTRQILMTTHSPDLVDAAEPDEVVPVQRAADGSTEVLALDRRKLKKWLKDFRLGELWKVRQLGAVP